MADSATLPGDRTRSGWQAAADLLGGEAEDVLRVVEYAVGDEEVPDAPGREPGDVEPLQERHFEMPRIGR